MDDPFTPPTAYKSPFTAPKDKPLRGVEMGKPALQEFFEGS
jgi:hypothetical protein